MLSVFFFFCSPIYLFHLNLTDFLSAIIFSSFVKHGIHHLHRNNLRNLLFLQLFKISYISFSACIRAIEIHHCCQAFQHSLKLRLWHCFSKSSFRFLIFSDLPSALSHSTINKFNSEFSANRLPFCLCTYCAKYSSSPCFYL